MSYSIESDKIIAMMTDWTSAKTGEILHDLIQDDIISKEKLRMYEGESYYSVENSYIGSKSFNEANILGREVEIPNAPNNKIKHGYYRISIDQKVGYIGDPQLVSDDDSITEQITDVLGEEISDIYNDWEKGASNKGREYLHPYINEGELDFVIFPATQIIPIYDTRFQKKLVTAIRYYVYELKEDNKTKDLHKVEIYTDKNIEFWTEIEEGKYRHDESVAHFTVENTKNGTSNQSWGEVPIIELQNNTEKSSDLYLAKDLVDDYDLHKSIFSNDLEAIQESLLHIQGYNIQGSTPAEQSKEWGALKENILKLKMILTNGENDKVEAITQEIPHNAKDSHLDRTRKEIFTLLMAVDPQLVGDGNITNIVIKTRYLLLDMKVNLIISKLKKSLRKLLWFVSKYSEYANLKTFDHKDVKITVAKNGLVNEAEVIQNLMMSTDLSEETRLEKHPYVEDLALEQERKAKEIDTITDDFNDNEL